MLGGSTLLLYLGIVFEVPAEDQEIRLSLDPSKIVVNLTEGNTYTEIVSLRNIGSDLTDINIDKYPDKKCSWLILSDFESPILNKSESGFIRVELNAANMDVGVYRNFIKIEGRMDDKTKSSELLPVVLNVEPIKERRDVKLDFSYVT